MIRKNLYIILVSVTVILFGCIIVFSKKPTLKVPTYKERTGSIALTGEWLNTKQAIDGLLKSIELNPKDYKSKLNLSQAYIQEARITGDHAYYDQAALELLEIPDQPFAQIVDNKIVINTDVVYSEIKRKSNSWEILIQTNSKKVVTQELPFNTDPEIDKQLSKYLPE